MVQIPVTGKNMREDIEQFIAQIATSYDCGYNEAMNLVTAICLKLIRNESDERTAQNIFNVAMSNYNV